MRKLKSKKEYELRLRTINEVARYIMRYADYSGMDTFHIPLGIMKSLMNGIIPYEEEKQTHPEPS